MAAAIIDIASSGAWIPEQELDMVHVDPLMLSAAAPNPNALIRSTACLAHIIESSTVWHVKATPPHDGSVALEADIARGDSKVWSRLEPLAYDLFHNTLHYVFFSYFCTPRHIAVTSVSPD